MADDGIGESSSSAKRVCVIGAGAAGLTLAHALAARGVSVVLVEGGAEQPPDDTEDTFRAESIGVPHRGTRAGRFRSWGGSTTRWGGQLWPWEPHEFAGRPDLGVAGWPIDAASVTDYYGRSFALLGIPDGTLTPRVASDRGVVAPPLDANTFAIKYSAWLPWRLRNLGRSLGSDLRRHPNVEHHLQTTAIGIVPAVGGRRATAVRVRQSDGSVREITADTIVIAAGTIETARLLFASATALGLARTADWIGRGFMDHLSVRIGRFRTSDREAFSRMFAPVFVGRVQHTPRILLQPEILHRERLLGAYGHWDVELPPESGLVFLRERLRSIQAGRVGRPSLADVVRGAKATGDILHLARGLVFHRRRPFPRNAMIHLRVDTEQRPDPESRVIPAGGLDSLGLPRVNVDWRVSDDERRTVRRTAELLGAELERRGIGSLAEWADPFRDDVPWGEEKGDSFHMMGGARMAARDGEGVVDTDLRVFGTENVYLAGASVFPTGGMANPTLTLIALTLRLADHLSASNRSGISR